MPTNFYFTDSSLSAGDESLGSLNEEDETSISLLQFAEVIFPMLR